MEPVGYTTLVMIKVGSISALPVCFAPLSTYSNTYLRYLLERAGYTTSVPKNVLL